VQNSIKRAWHWLYYRTDLGRHYLFVSIVWRVWDVMPDGYVYRLSWSTAWGVARDVHRS